MSTLTMPPSFAGGYHSFRRFSVDEYHRMIEAGILNELDRVELLEGYVVVKMARNPPHDGTIDLVNGCLSATLPAGWFIRIQQAVTLTDSEPEPDLVIVRGNRRSFLARHPVPADVGLLVEIADSSLPRDRDDKGRIFARAGIIVYWIVNLQDRQVEVYSSPSGPSSTPAYGSRQDFHITDSIPLNLEGKVVAQIRVQDLIP